jgi:NAD+ diphosphatase
MGLHIELPQAAVNGAARTSPARIQWMQRRNILAGPYLDRAAHLRQDPQWFATALADERSRYLPIWNSRNLVTAAEPPRAALLELSVVPQAQRNADDLILLGRFGGIDVFAFELLASEPPQLQANTRFEDLRMVAALLSAEDAGLLGYARGMISWRARHRFCGTCGWATLASKGGHVLMCTNPACRHEQFPRTDPAIIVLVSDGERALLGRQASWPVGRYSTIAGFVEPGESLEDAVAREVFEETGIEVDHIEYHSSQPWPFPASLMLGFTAHARTTEIHRRDDELEDARWFTRADLASGWPSTPPGVSISFRLIEHWFNAGGGPTLREIQKTASSPAAR